MNNSNKILVTTKPILDFLKSRDSVFESLSSLYGLIEHNLYSDLFSAIVSNIIGQMLSNNVAKTIFNRFLKLCGDKITPSNISSLDNEEIRNCGISYSKIKYIKAFSDGCLNGEYDFSFLNNLNDDDAVRWLMQIKGVGRWTAEMVALFSLGRENIFSYDDVALRNGILKAKGFKTLSSKRFDSLRKRYSPYCSYASLYFYKLNDDKNIGCLRNDVSHFNDDK